MATTDTRDDIGDAPVDQDELLEESRPSTSADSVPRLAEEVELIGQYEDSGYKDPPYLIQKGNGQVVQVTKLLFHIAEEIDGEHDTEAIADLTSEKTDTEITGDNVDMLVERKLRPLGILENEDGSQPNSRRISPLLALNFRAAVIPEGVVRTLGGFFKPLFWTPLVVGVVAAFVAVEFWLFGIHGVADSFRQSLQEPMVMLFILGMVVLSAAFHEIGHAAGAVYSGATPGVMGAGLYLVWPAFYTDVTDAYRLDRGGRLRTDLGGLYFNTIVSVVVAGIYFGTGFEPLLAVIVVQNLEMLHQLLPVVRLDGYYVIADLVGVPDLFARMRPILRSMLPWRKTEEGAYELKRWARIAVTVWVLVTVPALIFFFGMMAFGFPRVAATAWETFLTQYRAASDAFGSGEIGPGLIAILQILALTLPVLGMGFALGSALWRLFQAAWVRVDEVQFGRPALASVMAVGMAALGFLWWPSGEYQPIQEGERWTIAETFQAARAAPTGNPGIVYRSLAEGATPDEAVEQATTPQPTDTSQTSTQQAPSQTSPEQTDSQDTTTESSVTTSSTTSSSTTSSSTSSTTSTTSTTTTTTPPTTTGAAS